MNDFSFKGISLSKVIDPSISLDLYTPIDLSITNPDLHNFHVASSAEWEQYIIQYLHSRQAKVAYGGYLEKRNLYKRSNYFNSEGADRNIHLGVDLWVAAGTSVHAVCDGVVHSFQDNQNHGDYGPTIVLQHETQGKVWHSLYGHLSRESLKNLQEGRVVEAGERIANLGDASENGDYAPHLHFQLILNMESMKGDYPGVCSEFDLDHFKKNGPDPGPFLGLI